MTQSVTLSEAKGSFIGAYFLQIFRCTKNIRAIKIENLRFKMNGNGTAQGNCVALLPFFDDRKEWYEICIDIARRACYNEVVYLYLYITKGMRL